MRELERFGRYLLREIKIQYEPDWDYLIRKYKQFPPKAKHYTLNHINYTVARVFKIPSGRLHEKTKQQKVCIPRQVAQYFMSICGYTHLEIAEFYATTSKNGLDFSNISSNLKTVSGWYDTNRQLREKIDKLREKLL